MALHGTQQNARSRPSAKPRTVSALVIDIPMAGCAAADQRPVPCPCPCPCPSVLSVRWPRRAPCFTAAGTSSDRIFGDPSASRELRHSPWRRGAPRREGESSSTPTDPLLRSAVHPTTGPRCQPLRRSLSPASVGTSSYETSALQIYVAGRRPTSVEYRPASQSGSGTVMCPDRRSRTTHTPAEMPPVSPEEREWLAALADGASVSDLAARFSYSERAVYRRLASLYRSPASQTGSRRSWQPSVAGSSTERAPRLSRSTKWPDGGNSRRGAEAEPDVSAIAADALAVRVRLAERRLRELPDRPVPARLAARDGPTGTIEGDE